MIKYSKLKKFDVIDYLIEYAKLYLQNRDRLQSPGKSSLMGQVLTYLILLCVTILMSVFCFYCYQLLLSVSLVKVVFLGAIILPFTCWIADWTGTKVLRSAANDQSSVNFNIVALFHPLFVLGTRVAIIVILCAAIRANPSLPVVKFSTTPQGLSSNGKP